MNDDPVLAAVQKFMDAVEARMTARENEIRGLLDVLETRAIPKVIEGPPGPAGKDGANGVDGKDGINGKDGAPGIGEKGERGADGLNGKDGAPSTVPGPKGDKGERGADGIATREELNSIVEQRFAEIQVRTFADVYQGVYENGRLYTRGLLTTWGGSLWLSKVETRGKPGESPDWSLVVKRGDAARK